MTNKNKTAPLRELFALPHHARGIKPIVDALVYSVAASGVVAKWDKSRKNKHTNTWFVDITKNGSTTRYYIRYRKNPDRVLIHDSYQHPNTIASLMDQRDVLRFVNGL